MMEVHLSSTGVVRGIKEAGFGITGVLQEVILVQAVEAREAVTINPWTQYSISQLNLEISGCMADREQNIVQIKAHKKWSGKKCVAHQPNFMVKVK